MRVLNSLAFKIGGIVIAIEVLALTAMGFYYNNRFGEQVDRRVIQNVQEPSRLMEQGLLRYDAVADQTVMRQLVGEELVNGMVVGVDGNVFHALNPDDLGKNVAAIPGIDANWFEPTVTQPIIEKVIEGKDTYLVSITPLFAIDGRTPFLFAYIKAQTNEAEAEKMSISRLFIIGATLSVVLTSAVILISFQGIILTRLKGLLAVVRRVEAGDLTTRVRESLLPDEIGILQNGVNSMAAQLEETIGTLEQRMAERKHAEEELREREEFVTAILENIPNMVFVKDAEELRFVRFNKAGEDLLGYPREELMGKNDYDFFPQHEADFFTQKDKEVLEKGVLEDIPEEPIHTRFQGERILHTKKIPILDQNGDPRYLLGISEDITERKQAEAQLLASEQLFRALVENSPDFVARYDREFRRIYVNPALQRLFTGSAARVIGKTPADQSPIYAPQVYIEHLQQVIETATESVLETPFRTAQGEMHWGQIRFVPEFDSEGKVATVLTIGRDIHEIKENEQRFRMLAENFPDFVARFNHNYRFTYVNPVVAKVFGMPAAAFLGKKLQEFQQRQEPEQTDALLALIRRAFDEGVTNDTEIYWNTQMGKRIFKIRHVPEKDAAGNVVTVLSIAQDITKRKQAEEEHEAHLQFLEHMDQVNRAIQSTNDLDQMMSNVLDIVLSIFDCDRAFLMYPCDPDASFWFSPMEHTRPEYPGFLTLGIDEVPMDAEVAETFRIMLDADGPVKFGPGTPNALPGDVSERFDIKSFMSMALYPKVDKPWQFGIHQCSDARIWTQKEERLFQEIGRRLADALTSLLAYRSLHESEERYRALYHENPSMFFTLDAEETIISANDFGAGQLGYTKDELEGQPVRNVFYEEDKAAVSEKLKACLQNPWQVYHWQFRKVRKDGSLMWVEEFARTVNEPDGEIYVLVVCQDISDRKHAEEQVKKLNQELEQRIFERTAQLETANKELEAFAYSVSHDLRAPLRHIDGFLELLQQRIGGGLDERSQHYFSNISSAARRMGQLIDDLLAFSRMGRYELSKTQVDLGALVHEIVQELEPETENRTVHWQIANLPTVKGDGAMLRLVLTNLIANALKFTQTCTPAEIEIGSQADEKEAIFFVRDNGVGFDMAYADKLFGVFQRLHPIEEFEGTGIGLATVHRIIQRHGGRTWAEGKIDEGAAFYFSLPLSNQGA